MRQFRPLMVLGFMLSLNACEPAPPKVHSPHWGKDTCDVCRMAITERPPAAQLVGPGAQVRYYDDLGCAVNALLTARAPKSASLYVLSEGADARWIRAQDARFSAALKTPMDYGYMPSSSGKLNIDEVIQSLRAKHGRRWGLGVVQ